MPVDLHVTSLPESALDEAAAIQARAVFDDPLVAFLFPVERERWARLPWLMRIGITYGWRFGLVETTAGTMLGHAVWLPPGSTRVGGERLAEAGFVEPERHMGTAALARFGAFVAQVSTVHERLMPEPHWYLMILGVDPPHQGQRVGSALVQSMLVRADAEEARCYLETSTDRSVPFYQKHGFDVAEEIEVAGGGPHLWIMVRGARSRVLAA